MLLVCEGERTEPEYLRGLERHQRDATLALTFARDRGDPRKLVEIAKALRSKAEKGDYDAIWCVFDRDDHERFAAAIDMARANGFEVAASNPCFELWLLLHHRESPGSRHRHDVQSLLVKSVPGCDKGVDFAAYAPHVEGAIARAKRLDADAEAMDEAGRNPTTGVWRLVASIRGDP